MDPRATVPPGASAPPGHRHDRGRPAGEVPEIEHDERPGDPGTRPAHDLPGTGARKKGTLDGLLTTPADSQLLVSRSCCSRSPGSAGGERCGTTPARPRSRADHPG